MQNKRILQFKNRKTQGQGIVEFAIVLPVVLLIVFGVIELGFLLFTYSSVNSAAREAARYGIAIGDVGADQRYYDCDGIVEAGLRIGRFAGMTSSDIAIAYDHGPGTAQIPGGCPTMASNGGDGVTFGDRIVISVNHQYNPLISYMGLNITPFTMRSTSARTIFKGAEIIPGGGEGAGGGGGGAGTGCFTLSLTGAGGTAVPPVAVPSENCTTGAGYTDGTDVVLTGQPQANWHVDVWTGVDSVDTFDDSVAYVKMTSDKSVVVSYAPDSDTCYSLATPLYDGEGSTPTASPSSVCASGYAEGEVIIFTGLPAPGWGVSGWTNAIKLDRTTASLEMPAVDGYQVSAQYVPCYSVTAYSESSSDWGGTPQVLTESDSCGPGTFREAETITLQSYPNSGYNTSAWNGATQNPSNEDQATYTMGAADAVISVAYEEEPIFTPPSSLYVPNDFSAGDFNWNNGGGGNCTAVVFQFADSLPPTGNWPRLPDYYNVYVKIETAGGFSTSVYQVTSTEWLNGASVGSGYDISFGVEAVFLGAPNDTSTYTEVTYTCFYQDLVYQGSLTK